MRWALSLQSFCTDRRCMPCRRNSGSRGKNRLPLDPLDRLQGNKDCSEHCSTMIVPDPR